MTDKRTWKDLWMAGNTKRPDETVAAYRERADDAWTTHNEDPGAGILTASDDEGLYVTDAVSDEPPAGDEGPIPEVLIEDPDQTLNVVITDEVRVTDGLTADMHPDDLIEGFGAVPKAPRTEAPGEMIDVPNAPGYRVSRPVYSAMWFYYRPGETTPQGGYPNAGLAMNAALEDYGLEVEMDFLSTTRPIGRTVVGRHRSDVILPSGVRKGSDVPVFADSEFPFGYRTYVEDGIWSLTRHEDDSKPDHFIRGGLTSREAALAVARQDLAERSDPERRLRKKSDGDFPYGYYTHVEEGVWSVLRREEGKLDHMVRGGLDSRTVALAVAKQDYAERNLSASEAAIAEERVKGLLAHRGVPVRPSAAVKPVTQPVILESPYAGDVERNTEYARLALADCLARGEAPFASHLLYTQVGVLDDSNAEERARGIEAGFVVGESIGKAVFYLDYGMSPGMAAALVRFAAGRKVIEFRFLGLKKAEDL